MLAAHCVVGLHRNAVVLDILHDELLALGEFEWSKRISLADDWNDVDERRKAAHQLDVQLAQSVACKSISILL